MTQPRSGSDERDIEAPEDDVAEQHTEVSPDAPRDSRRPDVPLDADPADVSEQDREIGYDDEDYR
jgi:hypothetical protein